MGLRGGGSEKCHILFEFSQITDFVGDKNITIWSFLSNKRNG